MAASRTISIRLTLEEADQFRTALKAAGADGEASLKKITDAASKTGSGLKATTEAGKLASYQLVQVAEEAHKFADQVLAGGSALKAFAFQAPNMVASAGGLKNALAAVTGLFTPFRLGALAAVGGVTALVVAAESADARMVKLRNSLVGYTSDYAALAKRIDQSSKQQASQLGLSSSDVRSAQTAITVALPTLNDADVQKAVQLGQQLALTLDKDLGAAMQRLAGLARDPSTAIKQLAEQGFAGLSAELIRNIDLMQRSGDRLGAYRLAADALGKTLGGAEMTAAQKATASLKAEFDSLWTSIAEGLAGPGAQLTSWLAANLKDVRERSERGDFMPAEPVIPDFATKPLFGGGAGSSATPGGPVLLGPPIPGRDERAHGLMQVLPSTAASFGLNPDIIEQNIKAGLLDLKQKIELAGGNEDVGLAHYGGATSPDKMAAYVGAVRSRNPSTLPPEIAELIRTIAEQNKVSPDRVRLLQQIAVQESQGHQNEFRSSVLRQQAATQTATVERDRGRDLGGGQYGPPAPGRLEDSDYLKATEDARSKTLEGRRQNLSADIAGTQKALQEAQIRGDQGAAADLTGRLRDQRAELEKLRSPVQDYIKGLQDQSAAAKQDSGSAGEVAKALADLNRAGKDSGWQVTEADRAEVTRLTLARLSAGYAKIQADIGRSAQANQSQAAAWLQSDAAGREYEARQKAINDARQFFAKDSPDFNAAVEAGTKKYLDLAASAAAAAAAMKLSTDRREAETLSLQTDLARRGAGPDETARAMAALQAKQGLEGVTDPATRQAVMASSSALEEQRLAYQKITANTNELQNFADSAFDKIGSDITQAFANGSTAALDFGSIGKAVISELGQELLKLAIINPLKNAIGGENSALPTLTGVAGKVLGSSLFGGGAAAVTPAVSTAGLAVGMGAVYHTGGIAGSEPTGLRMLPTSLFHGAPRFHTGGIANDEVPAVLKAGEGVFTQGQMAALGAGMAANGNQPGGDTHLHLNINAQGAGPREIDELRNQIPALALAAVSNASQRGGRFPQQVRGSR